jgi:hypothetical protein
MVQGNERLREFSSVPSARFAADMMVGLVFASCHYRVGRVMRSLNRRPVRQQERDMCTR